MMMETESGDSEKISEAFMCCICRDLIYKPVVLACGHISCFWCVHKSMSGLYKSRCPLCRSQYYHFPYVCQMLHMLLLKLYPISYGKREIQVLEEEKEIGYFSPQMNGPTDHVQPQSTTEESDATPHLCEAAHLVNQCSAGAGECLLSTEPVQPSPVVQEIGSDDFLVRQKALASASVQNSEGRNSIQRPCIEIGELVSVDDLLCCSCKEMLFQPAVLNCGHVFCISCIRPPKGEALECEVCQIPHPGAFPKVCLEFDHFLEEQFPCEYGLRRGNLQDKLELFPRQTDTSSSSEAGMESFHFSFSTGEDPLPWWNANSKVHIGVGCDSCGMYPLIGDRYRCKDCVEEIGFDLCKDCYTTRSKLPGRFNQQHTSEHKFEIVKSNAMQNIMLGLLDVLT